MEGYFKSLSQELSSLKNRVRNFIKDKHWLSDGEWKESVLRASLLRCLPADIKVGRGFIYTPDALSTQIDVLLYGADAPLLFKDGDLVIVQPEAVRGVIEVKTNLDKAKLKKAISKIKKVGEMIPDGNRAFISVFSYDSTVSEAKEALELIQGEIKRRKQVIDFISLGDSRFIKYWEYDPAYPLHSTIYEKWHSYRLKDMAYGYFIHNVLQAISPEYIAGDQNSWFPSNSKEAHKETEILRNRGKDETRRVDLEFFEQPEN